MVFCTLRGSARAEIKQPSEGATTGLVNKNRIPCQAIGAAVEQSSMTKQMLPSRKKQGEDDLRTEIGCPRFKRELTRELACPTDGRVM